RHPARRRSADAVMSITIFLADDHAVLRDGLRSLIEAHADLTVVGEAANGPDAVAGIERLRPELAVMDISMPGLDGIAVAQTIRERCPAVHMVMLSVSADPENIYRALQ